ncbi:MAG: GNAT family N-acetyltransferase [Candidatus Nanopelagicales bacterium]
MWTLTRDVEEFAAAVAPLVAQDPSEATLLLSTVAIVRAAGPMAPGQVFGWWSGSPGPAAVVVTPPYPALVHAGPHRSLSDHAAAALLGALAAAGIEPPGVESDPSTAARVAALWQAGSGGSAALGHVVRLMRLEELRAGDAPSGTARRASAGDAALLMAWLAQFAAETGMPAAPALSMRDRLSYGGWHLWCDPDGAPVSLAGRGRELGGVARIGPVYTPPGLRGRGFGGAATAAAARDALTVAEDVVLFAEVANATSRGLYARLGFVDHAERVAFEFRATGRSPETAH